MQNLQLQQSVAELAHLQRALGGTPEQLTVAQAQMAMQLQAGYQALRGRPSAAVGAAQVEAVAKAPSSPAPVAPPPPEPEPASQASALPGAVVAPTPPPEPTASSASAAQADTAPVATAEGKPPGGSWLDPKSMDSAVDKFLELGGAAALRLPAEDPIAKPAAAAPGTPDAKRAGAVVATTAEDGGAEAGASINERWGWMPAGASCGRCRKVVVCLGGVHCGRLDTEGRIMGCGVGVCWRCMARAPRDDLGAIRTTRAEFAERGERAWWMHERCLRKACNPVS